MKKLRKLINDKSKPLVVPGVYDAIGAKIAQKVGLDNFKKFLNSLGLLNTLDFDIEEIGTGEHLERGEYGSWIRTINLHIDSIPLCPALLPPNLAFILPKSISMSS